MEYHDFIAGKESIDLPTGNDSPIVGNASMFDFQRDIVRWSAIRGRAAIFADCGMGKTLMQLAWAEEVPGDI